MTYRLAAVGDNCIDAYHEQNQYFAGGNAVNVAVYTKRLGGESSYTGFIGTDHHGRILKKALTDEQVDVSHLYVKPGKTAVTEVKLEGSNRILGDYDEGVMKDFFLTDDDLSFLGRHQVVHTGLWGRTVPYLKRLKETGVPVSFDFADKLNHPDIPEALPDVAFAFFSHDKNDDFIRDFLTANWQKGPRYTIATLGEHGSLGYDGREMHFCPIAEASVVDTMGAGDSFIAGFLNEHYQGATLSEAMRAGARNAAITIGYHGSW